MFVTDFKKIQKKARKFKTYEHLYKWNQNTEKLEKVKVDWQDEINKYKCMDLKSMLDKGILPKDEKPLNYGDATQFKNMTIHKIHQLSKVDIQDLVDLNDISKIKAQDKAKTKEMNKDIQNDNSQELENKENSK